MEHLLPKCFGKSSDFNTWPKKAPRGTVLCEVCDAFIPIDHKVAHWTGKKHAAQVELDKKYPPGERRSIFVTKLPLNTSHQELKDYFSEHGTVTNIYIPEKKCTHAYVEFSCPVDQLDIFSKKHTLKGKVMEIKKIKEPPPYGKEKFKTHQSVTRGQYILDKIKDISSVDMQVKKFIETVKLSDSELLKQQNFVASFASSLQKVIPGSRLELLGSTANRLAFTGCDLDLNFCLPYERDEINIPNVERSKVPKPEDVLSGKLRHEDLLYFSRDNLMSFLSKYIDTLPDFRVFRIEQNGKHHAIKFQHDATSLVGKMAFCRSLSRASTRLLGLYGQLDVNIYALLMALRFWGKRNGFVEGSEKITSYAFTLLIIFYLQRRELCPTVEKLASLSDTKVEVEGWDCTFFEDISRIPVGTHNKTFVQLLSGFFEFYATFDFTANVLCPRDGSVALKSDLVMAAGKDLDFKITSMSVQDVFELTQNTTSLVNDETVEKFQTACKEQNKVWNELVAQGLAHLKYLFDPAIPKIPTVALVAPPNAASSVFIPLKSVKKTKDENDVNIVCNFVLEVLKRAFLFDCHILSASPDFMAWYTRQSAEQQGEDRPRKVPRVNPSEAPVVLHVSSDIYHRTWMGRQMVSVAPADAESKLAVEESIARELAIRMANPELGNVLYVLETMFSYIHSQRRIVLSFIPKTSREELASSLIIFLEKYILAITESCLVKYLNMQVMINFRMKGKETNKNLP